MPRKDTFSGVSGEMLVRALVCIARETPKDAGKGPS